MIARSSPLKLTCTIPEKHIVKQDITHQFRKEGDLGSSLYLFLEIDDFKQPDQLRSKCPEYLLTPISDDAGPVK
ncbi:MAG: hypothetical protein IPP42_01905 [Saprospiraceae bacterium]|nr:hypothetical protein [Saprospiraceae bacterium]